MLSEAVFQTALDRETKDSRGFRQVQDLLNSNAYLFEEPAIYAKDAACLRVHLGLCTHYVSKQQQNFE